MERMLLASRVVAGETVHLSTGYRAKMVAAYAQTFLGVKNVRRDGCTVHRPQVTRAAS